MTIPSPPLLTVWILASLVGSSLAQTNKLFQWQFANAALSSLLPTCTPLQIVVKSFDPTTNATNGTPPYYMISFAVGGTPVTTFIGTDENNLSWTITQPVDSKLMLSVVDANGSAGGIPPQLSTVIAGQSTRCVTPPSTPSFTVTANVTDELTTCQPWGLTVKGGVPPYNVTLAAVNSPIVTNVTMPFGLDVFTFIDRADPNTQLLAAISDFTGQWAFGTPIVKTKGQTDVSCVGLVSSSGNSTQIKQQQDAANAAQSAKRKHSAVVGVAVTLVLLVVFGLAGAAFFQLRKRKREAEEELAQTRPTQFVEPEPKMEPDNNYPEPPVVSGKAALAMREAQNSYSNAVSGLHRPSPSQPSSDLLSSQDTLGRSTSATATGSTDVRPQHPGSQLSNPGFAKFPTTSIRRSAKASEASGTTTRPSDSEHPESPFKDRRSPLTMTRVDEEFVFQHRDADRVQELPPPYADRARRSRPSSS